MKFMKLTLPRDVESIRIELFSDLHLGSPKCDYKLIQERVEFVKNTPNCYAMIIGDVCNTAIKSSVSDVYSEELTPMQECELAVKTFAPIKDKIIGAVSGNHERRITKETSIDTMWMIAKELGIIDYYDYCSGLLFIRLGVYPRDKSRQNAYSIYFTHGDGQGGRTVGGKANGLERRGQIVDSDIVITGHTHSPMTFRNSFYRVNYQLNKAHLKEQVFVNASSTLKYEEYAELYGMKPSSNTSPSIILSGKTHDIQVIT